MGRRLNVHTVEHSITPLQAQNLNEPFLPNTVVLINKIPGEQQLSTAVCQGRKNHFWGKTNQLMNSTELAQSSSLDASSNLERG